MAFFVIVGGHKKSTSVSGTSALFDLEESMNQERINESCHLTSGEEAKIKDN